MPSSFGARLLVERRVVGLFELHRGHHAEAVVQASLVVPVDPAGGGVLDVDDGLVGPVVKDRGADVLGFRTARRCSPSARYRTRRRLYRSRAGSAGLRGVLLAVKTCNAGSPTFRVMTLLLAGDHAAVSAVL